MRKNPDLFQVRPVVHVCQNWKSRGPHVLNFTTYECNSYKDAGVERTPEIWARHMSEGLCVYHSEQYRVA